jgi:hypothetical protein
MAEDSPAEILLPQLASLLSLSPPSQPLPHRLLEGSSPQLFAVCETAYLAAVSDGLISPTEINRVSRLLGAISQETHDVARLFGEYAAAMETDGVQKRLALLASQLDAEGRRLAFVAAAATARARGKGKESAMFAAITRAFEIPAEEAESLLQRVRRQISDSRQARLT